MTRSIPIFIVNPVAGGGACANRWRELARRLQKADCIYEVEMTSPGRGTEQIARDAWQKGSRLPVAVGGDGTLQETINGIMSVHRGVEPPTIGFVPFGSSNDFWKEFRVPCDAFTDRLRRGESQPVDLCSLRCCAASGESRERYFVANSSIGVIARSLVFFNRRTRTDRFLRRIHPDLDVVKVGLQSIATASPMECSVAVDGRQVAADHPVNITVVKARYFGGGMRYLLDSAVDDGWLHVVGVNHRSRLRMLAMIPRFYAGNVLTLPGVWHARGSVIHVLGDHRQPVEADGEIIGGLPATYSVRPMALRVIL